MNICYISTVDDTKIVLESNSIYLSIHYNRRLNFNTFIAGFAAAVLMNN